jgi:murein L,D-transpeptidase YafK
MICLSRCLMLLFLLMPYAMAQVDSIEIIKHRYELNLIKDDKVVKTFRVSLGRQPKGRKMDKNDKRTPVGQYKIRRKISPSEYYKSLVLDYPTPEEKADAEMRRVDIGDHLCIHGIRSYLSYLPSFLQKMHRWVNWTTGCIALSNDEIDAVFEEVEEGTPVVIYE